MMKLTNPRLWLPAFIACIGIAFQLSEARALAQAPDGLALAYAFSGTSTVATDTSGNGNDGTLVNGATWTSAGRFAGGLDITATDAGIQLPTSEGLELTDAFTFEAWVKPTGRSGNLWWTSQAAIDVRPDGTMVAWAFSVGGQVGMVSNWPLAPGVWSHIAVSYDGTLLQQYINGVDAGSRAGVGPLRPTPPGELKFIGGPSAWGGTIDEVRLYRRALSATDVALDYVTPVDPVTPLQVGTHAPADQAVGVVRTTMTATFTRAVDVDTVTALTVVLTDPANTSVPATVTYDAATRTATLTPTTALAPLTVYSMRMVGGSAGVHDATGGPLAADVAWTFKTAAALSGPSLVYALNETSGVTATDTSGNMNDGTLVSGATWTTAGRFGGALDISASEAGIQLPVRESLQLTDAFTFEAWVKPTGRSGNLWWTSQAAIDVRPDGTLVAWAFAVGGQVGMTSNWPLAPGVWSHVAVTYDGTLFQLYINGLDAGSRAGAGSLRPTPPGEVGFVGGPSAWGGTIDEVRLYRRALTGSEVLLDWITPIDPATPLQVGAYTPPNQAVGIVRTTMTATFTRAVDAGTITPMTVTLSGPASASVPASVTYDAATRVATLTPTSALAPLTVYTMRVVGGSAGVHDATSGMLATDVVWSFKTAAAVTGPALVYALNETTGATAIDTSGNTNDGTLVNGATWTTAGQFSGGLDISASEAGIQLPVRESLQLTDAFTFEAWVKPAGRSGNLWWTSQASVYITDDGTVVGWAFSVGGQAGTASNWPLTAGVWSHVAVTYDGTLLQLYINGVDAGSGGGVGPMRPTPPGEIGFVGGPSAWGGSVDEVRLYRRALSASEVATDRDTAVGVAAPTVTIAVTSPFPGTTYNSPSSLPLAANASVANGSIASVAFMVGGTTIGSATSAPYQSTWQSIAPGAYSLVAVATDNTGHTTSSAPIAITVTNITNSLGVLGAPSMTPSAGTYPPSQAVTLTAAPGTTIRYTTDGSVPTVGSTIYTGPISLTQDATITAEAFESNWGKSSLTTQMYVVHSGPSVVITTTLSPAPNAAGWNNRTVTASFTCEAPLSAVSSCPQPIMFDQDGANQTVTVTASDTVGGQTTAQVVVNIDKALPIVALSAPADGTATTASTLSIAATITDTPSGATSVTCNGAAATFTEGIAQCDVDLNPGTNSIVMRATNAAGGSVSRGFRAIRTGTPTTLRVSPHSRTVAVGDSFSLATMSEYGPVSDVTWTSSDSAVVTLSEDGGLLAEAAGTATLTATIGDLSAEALVTVMAVSIESGSLLLEPGTVLWTGPAPSNQMIPAHRVDDTGSDFFTVDPGDSSETVTVIGTTADGQQLVNETTSSTPLFGDVYGGMIAALPFNAGFEKMLGSADAPPWRYEPPSGTSIKSSAAQAPDGTVHFVERQDDGTYAVGLDGRTGQVKFRTLIPVDAMDVTRPDPRCFGLGPFTNSDYFTPESGGPTSVQPSPLVVGADSAVYFEVSTSSRNWTPQCEIPDSLDGDNHWIRNYNWQPGAGHLAQVSQLSVIRVNSAGAATATALPWQLAYDGPDTLASLTTHHPTLGTVVPDSQSGVFASWSSYYSESDGFLDHPGFAHVVGATVTALPSEWAAYAINPIQLTADSGTAYLAYWDNDFNPVSAALDASTGTILWTKPTILQPISETDSKQLVAIDYGIDYSTATHVMIERSGTLAGTTTIPYIQEPTVILHGQGLLHAVDLSGAVTEFRVPVVRETAYSFTQSTNSGTNNCVPPDYQVKFTVEDGQTKEHWKNLQPARTYKYKFMSPSWTTGCPRSENGAVVSCGMDGVRAAFNAWNIANRASWETWSGGPAILTLFQEAAETDTTWDIYLYKAPTSNPDTVGADSGSAGSIWDHATGIIIGGYTFYSTNTKLLLSDIGFQKVALHEIGHFLGLTDEPPGPGGRGIHGASVMDKIGEDPEKRGRYQDDAGGNIPLVVTVCDAGRASLAPLRPWP